MKRVFSFQIVFIFLLLTSSVLAKDTWLELKTPNFHLVGDVSEKELIEVGGRFEKFHQNLINSFSKFNFKTPFPTKVLVLQSNSKNSKKSQSFIAADDANFIFISSDTNYADIFQNYTKLLINNNLGQQKIPAWLNYGLAEYFSNRSSSTDLLLSQSNNLSNLKILLETDYFTLQNQSEDRKALFNAHSLAFLSFLLIENKTESFVKIEQLLEFFQQGKESRESISLAFQIDSRKIEDQFKGFLKSPKLLFKNEGSEYDQEFNVSLISEAKGLATVGDYFYYSNRLKEAKEILEKVLKSEPKQALALSTLALIKAKEFYYSEAEELAEEAIKNEPQNYLNFYRFAVVLSRQGMTEFGFVSGYHPSLAEKMRRALYQSIELNPLYPESYVLLSFVNYVRNEQLDESLRLLRNAFGFAPNNQRYLLRRAEINLRKENFMEARKDALAVYRFASNEFIKLYAQNTIQRIDSTEFQLARIRNEKTKYVNDDIVTEKPLTEEEIRKLREKAVTEQIRAVLRRPKSEEKRVLASLSKIECGREKIDFVFKTQNGLLRLQSKSFDGVNLISFIEELSDFRLNCGNINKENFASIIYGGIEVKTDTLISIEFVPKGFKF